MSEINTENIVDILAMTNGALEERVSIETWSVLENILDPNTSAKAKRSITIKIDFSPSADRQTINVETTVNSKLQSYEAIATTIAAAKTSKGIMSTELQKPQEVVFEKEKVE